MNKIYHPCLFQGAKQLKNKKDYFEGWYFKNTNRKETISFIPGIYSNAEEKEAFIQIITHQNSWYIPYPITDFTYYDKPFGIKIGNNYFSDDTMVINLHNKCLEAQGTLIYQDRTPITHHLFSPNIMGIFSFIPKMECHHAISSMKHSITGSIEINHEKILFEKGIGYIEKDWGISFPSSYVWGQANCFPDDTISLFFAVANIPFGRFHFQGFICNFICSGKEYRFATYNGSKILKRETTKQGIHIIFKKNHFILEVWAKNNQTSQLKAPKQGQMKNHIQESIQAEIEVTLKIGNHLIYQDKSNCAGLEIMS